MGRSAQNADKDVAEEIETARFQQRWMKFQPLSWEITEDLVHGDIWYVDRKTSYSIGASWWHKGQPSMFAS